MGKPDINLNPEVHFRQFHHLNGIVIPIPSCPLACVAPEALEIQGVREDGDRLGLRIPKQLWRSYAHSGRTS